MEYGYIVQCKLNQIDYELQELQNKRKQLLDEAANVEMEMRKLSFNKELIKKEYIKDGN